MPGTNFHNGISNYTANISPNFNVTSINIQSNHINLGASYYDLSRTSGIVNANITGFNESKNISFKITNVNTFPVTLTILGNIQQVQLDGKYYPAGNQWSYSAVTNQTTITVGLHSTVFASFTNGAVTGSKLYLSGYIYGNKAFFNQLILFVQSPPTSTVSEIGLFNQNGLLYDKQFSPVLSVMANQNFTIPYKFNDTNTGLQTYTAEAVVNNGTTNGIVISNSIQLYFGSFTPGNLNINATNPVTAGFKFTRNNINSTDTNVIVSYPSTFNSSCNLSYEFAQTNKTYSNLPVSQATFNFIGSGEIVTINCSDKNSNNTGTYVLNEGNSFPIINQITNFRNGANGTLGKFGAFDMVTLLALILSIIGFNRVNESVGAIFNVALIGALAYFGIIQWPVILSSGIALVLVLVISSTRKTQGF